MKRLLKQLLLLVLIIATLTVSTNGSSVTYAATANTYSVTASYVTVRSDAGRQYSSVGKITKGSVVTVSTTKALKDGSTWANISYQSISGWVNMGYLAKYTAPVTTDKTGWYKVSGTWKYYSKGKVTFSSNAMYTAYTKIKGKTSGTSYYAVLDKTNFYVFVFQKVNGDWVPVKAMLCSHGAVGTPTPSGLWEVTSRWYALTGTSSWEYYPVEFCHKGGVICFHSVLYYPGVPVTQISKAKIKNGTLGKRISHGCVRLELSNAKWIWDHCTKGTKVLVY